MRLTDDIMLLVPSGHHPPPGFTLKNTHTLHGYQLYAVEKWVVDRERPYPLLIVYTADPTHTVLVDALEPASEAHMRDIVHLMRLDARPKQTQYGTLMVTSLAHFRSDYTIVLVEGGVWTNDLRVQLHANINLLRFGAAGRTALTLSAPSDSTKDRFHAAYILPHGKDKSDSNSTTTSAVIELVKLVQAALFLLGFSKVPQDGLLCDATLSALSSWAAQRYPEHRIPSPSLIAILLSLIFTVRNRLSALYHGHLIPKDPFAAPNLFSSALANLPAHNTHTPNFKTPAPTPVIPALGAAHITPSLIDALLAMEPPETPLTGAGAIIEPINDINVFVAMVLAQDKGDGSLGGIVRGIGMGKGRRRGDEEGKEIGGVVRALWGGTPTTGVGAEDSDADQDDLFVGLGAWNRKRVKDKLESWAGLSARRTKFKTAILNDDDETQLSSGQASPNSVSPSVPFAPPIIITREESPPNVLPPTSSLSSNGPHFPSTLRQKRPITNSRVTSWSIPKLSSSSTLPPGRPRLSSRRSFPPYPSRKEDEEILALEHMRLDVALAGEFLVLHRRQQHLAYVLRATELLTSRLVDTSAQLRSVYSTLEAGEDVGVLGELDTERVRASKMMQSVNTLWYEAEQMTVHDALHVAVGGRRKIVEVRGKVFGTRAGGGKGPVLQMDGKRKMRRKWKGENRQWRVGGEEVMVDKYGRTESEAEEEGRLEEIVASHLPEEEEDSQDGEGEEEEGVGVEVVEGDDGPQPVPVAWRPMWLLRFFTSWGRTRKDK